MQCIGLFMSDFNPDKSTFCWLIDAIFLLNIISWIVVSIMVGLLCAYDPRGAIFLGSIIPHQYYHFVMGIMIVLLHFGVTTSLCINISLTLGIPLVYILYLLRILAHELRLDLPTYNANNSMRKSENLQYVYRCFQVLHENFICFFGPYIFIAHVILSVLPVFEIVILILYWNQLNLITAAPLITSLPFNITFWNLVLLSGKHLYVSGSAVKHSWVKHNWKKGVERKVMKKFSKSCRLILIRWGNHLVVGRMTQFLYVKGLVRMLFKCMLTLKKIKSQI